MDVQYQRCAGLDVHKRTVVACVRLTTAADGTPMRGLRTAVDPADTGGFPFGMSCCANSQRPKSSVLRCSNSAI